MCCARASGPNTHSTPTSSPRPTTRRAGFRAAMPISRNFTAPIAARWRPIVMARRCSSQSLRGSLAMSPLLGTYLKLDGLHTDQTNSKGPIDLLTVDYYGAELRDDGGASAAGLRGYARLNEAARATLGKSPSVGALLGKGVMAITIEPRRGGSTYQGIVDLSPDGIAASAETYFAQSEQLPTVMRLAAAPMFVPGNREAQWRAGGMMLQVLPEGARDDDDFERLTSHLRSLTDLELVDSS